MTALLWFALIAGAGVFHFLGRAHGSYHTAALNLEVGLLRKQRDEARLDAEEKWGEVCPHDDGHTLRPPTKEKTH